MTRELVTATGNVTLEEAEKILMAKKVEKLLLIDEDFRLTGLITIKDIDMMRRYPQACKDGQGRLRAGAAVGVHDYDRIRSLIAKDVDVLVVDSAHGHSANVIETVRRIKKEWDIDVVAGNVATAQGCADLIAAGADAVKVGIGPGSICTTRVISGVGVPQITAIQQAARAAGESGTPIIADGGIRYSGDLTKAIAAGASVVMIGGLFAGLEESPGARSFTRGERSRCIEAWARWAPWFMAPANAINSPANADRTNWSPRASKAACPTRDSWGRSFTSSSAGCGLGWDIAEPERSRNCATTRDSSVCHQPVCGRAIPMTSRLRRKRQTTARNTRPATVIERPAGGGGAKLGTVPIFVGRKWDCPLLNRRPACIFVLLIAALASSPLAAADEAAGKAQATDADGWAPAKKADLSAEQSLSQAVPRTDAGIGWAPAKKADLSAEQSPSQPVPCTDAGIGWAPAKKADLSTERPISPPAQPVSPPAQRAAAAVSEDWHGVGGRVVATSAAMPLDPCAQRPGDAFADPFEDGAKGKVVAAGATAEATSPQAKTEDALLAPAPPSTEKLPTIPESAARRPAPTETCPKPESFKAIGTLTNNIVASAGKVPQECGLGDRTFQPRCWASKTYTWTASALCHKPLYFEDEQLERYGHACCGPLLEPLVSTGKFFLTLPVLPYEMGLYPPNECIYTLGVYRAGDCSPYMFDAIPLSVRASLFEAGGLTAGIVGLP